MHSLIRLIAQRPLAVAGALLCLLPCVSWGAESTATGKSEWWSFKPAVRPTLPQSAIGNPQSAINNPIDAFIRAKLA
jgi:hypothetical protein